jgi:hypothetical protein
MVAKCREEIRLDEKLLNLESSFREPLEMSFCVNYLNWWFRKSIRELLELLLPLPPCYRCPSDPRQSWQVNPSSLIRRSGEDIWWLFFIFKKPFYWKILFLFSTKIKTGNCFPKLMEMFLFRASLATPLFQGKLVHFPKGKWKFLRKWCSQTKIFFEHKIYFECQKKLCFLLISVGSLIQYFL